MLFGVCEVGGSLPLMDLMKLPNFKQYDFVHYQGLDRRGMGVALFYHQSEINLIESTMLPFGSLKFQDEASPTETSRDVLYCKINYRGQMLDVYVLHLPSKRNKDSNKPKRKFIANELKKHIVKSSFTNSDSIVILGDFNANPNDEIIIDLIGADEGVKLFNPFVEVYGRRNYSTFHRSKGLLYDQILVSNHFTEGNIPLIFHSADVFIHHQSNASRKCHKRLLRTFAGSRYVGGTSDHFPVLVEFKKNL